MTRVKLKQDKKDEIIGDYTEELTKRGAEEVNLSVKNTLTIHDWTKFMESPLMQHGITKMS